MKNYEKYADEIKEYNGTEFCSDFVIPYILKTKNCNCYCLGKRNYKANTWMVWLYQWMEIVRKGFCGLNRIFCYCVDAASRAVQGAER